MILALTAAGFLTYVLFPATPPWLASQQGHIPYLYRIIGYMWNHTDGMYPAAGLFQNGNEYVNEVAAVPSLHAAFPLMFTLFFWSSARGRPWLRALLVAYPLAMAFTLVYAGEHYVFDVLLGWIYAVGVYAAVTAVERARAKRRHARVPAARPAEAPLPGTARATI
jgi:membrane-associated phospholipid phosphatase